MIMCLGAVVANAQEVTYNHDKPKMNQFTVMETGLGSLTPEAYYLVTHNKYKRTANAKNKLGYRTSASAGAFAQTYEAERIDTTLTKRAKIETLNMTDRQVDLAWKTEGSKITASLEKFQKNINRIIPLGGSIEERKRWQEFYDMYSYSIRVTKNAYMPNSQRKREYLRIYADVVSQNEILVKQLVQIYNSANSDKLLVQSQITKPNKKSIAASAFNRWREVGRAGTSGISDSSDDAETIMIR